MVTIGRKLNMVLPLPLANYSYLYYSNFPTFCIVAELLNAGYCLIPPMVHTSLITSVHKTTAKEMHIVLLRIGGNEKRYHPNKIIKIY